MELLKIVRRRSFQNEVVYIALNIALAIAVTLLVRVTESPWPAILLVLLSKWRVLAVRPRYWYANIQANLVDYIVSIGIVVTIYNAYMSLATPSQKLFLISVLTILYVAWLLFLKPKSKRTYVVAQAGVALLVGVGALFTFAYALPASLVVLIMWLIGYASARHTLTSYDETHVLFLSLVWGVVLAEIGWLAYHWTVAYTPLGIESVMLPRVALTTFCISFIVNRAYDSYYHHQKIRGGDVILPLLFTVSIIIVLPLILNLLGANITVGI